MTRGGWSGVLVSVLFISTLARYSLGQSSVFSCNVFSDSSSSVHLRPRRNGLRMSQIYDYRRSGAQCAAAALTTSSGSWTNNERRANRPCLTQASLSRCRSNESAGIQFSRNSARGYRQEPPIRQFIAILIVRSWVHKIRFAPLLECPSSCSVVHCGAPSRPNPPPATPNAPPRYCGPDHVSPVRHHNPLPSGDHKDRCISRSGFVCSFGTHSAKGD